MTKFRARHLTDIGFRYLFKMAALASVFLLFGIFIMLSWNGARLFSTVDWTDFFLSAQWNPSAYTKAYYGIGAMLLSTAMVTLGAMAIAIPMGIGTAAYLSEVARPEVRRRLKPAIEMLAAIPSVVIGFLGIVILGPFLADIFHLPNGLNALNGAILLAFMALPTLITVAEDAVNSVPNSYKEASYALGANRWETLVNVTLPACKSGLIAAVMLGFGRAVGETMTVLMATGNATALPQSFFHAVRTITATIAIEMGEVPFGTAHYYSLYALGTVLFLITLVFNMIAESIAAGFRKKGQ